MESSSASTSSSISTTYPSSIHQQTQLQQLDTDAPASESSEPTQFKIFRPLVSGDLPAAISDARHLESIVAINNPSQAAVMTRSQPPLNTQIQQRESNGELQPKRDRWPETSIRIKFSDRTQIEKVFPSRSRIKSVYDFVQSCLREDVKHITFTLYQRPRIDFKLTDPNINRQSLAKLQLAPSSVLYVRFGDERLNGADCPAPLSSFVLDQAVDLPQPVSYPEPPSSNDGVSFLPTTLAGISSFWKKLSK